MTADVEMVDAVATHIAKDDEFVSCTEGNETASTDCSSTEENDDNHSTLVRSKSQVASQNQINRVLQHLEKRRALVEELKGHLELLTCNVQVDTDVAGKALLCDLDERLKASRNAGEDLLEDMLALDKLAGLHPEDRSKRKTAIASIEALLEIVDGSKAQIVKLRKEAKLRLDGLAAAVPQQHSSEENSSNEISRRSGHVREQDQQMKDLSTRPTINEAFWKDVQLAVDFRSREQRDAYVLCAQVPNLDSRSLRVAADPQRCMLTVSGLSSPSQEQSEQLRRAVASRMFKIPRNACPNEFDNKFLDVYRQFGQGHFGAFSQNFRLPVDTDADGIKCYCENGVLRVVIPRTQRLFRRGFGDGGFSW